MSDPAVERFADLCTAHLREVCTQALNPPTSNAQPPPSGATLAHFVARHGPRLALWIGQAVDASTQGAGDEAIGRPLDFLIVELQRFCTAQNQFCPLTPAALQTARAGFQKLFVELLPLARNPEAQGGMEELLGWQSMFLPTVTQALAHTELHLGQATCAHYSAALQARVLGLDDTILRAPILDIGCGQDATLVRALKAAGHTVTGIDRIAPADVGCVADFLTFDYGTEQFNTIVAHQSFSLHFLHAHLHSQERARAYAETYMRILQGLNFGGIFAYAPALPFFEGVLPPALYTHRQVPLPVELLASPALHKLQQSCGMNLGYASHICKKHIS